MSHIVVFDPDIQIYRGTRQITKDMLPAAVQSELPPEELASLGKIITLNRDLIKPLIAVRQRTTRLCEAYGTPFMKAYAVGLARASSLSEKLVLLKQEFMAHKRKLVDSYAASVEAMQQEFPKWATHIASLAGTADDVAAGTIFAVRKYKADIVELPGDNELQEDIANLPGNLRAESLSVLRAFLTENTGKEKVSQRGIKPLRDMGAKLADLSFIDGSLVMRASEFDSLLKAVPPSGPLRLGELESLKSNIRVLLGISSAMPGQANLFNEAEVII